MQTLNHGIKRLALVIPTYNEAENITLLFPGLPDETTLHFIIVVDDGSPDGTPARVREFAAVDSRVHIICRQGKRSFSHSYVEGFYLAAKLGADYIIQIDADRSHDLQDIPKIIAGLTDFDCIVASRYVSHGRIVAWNVLRRFVSRFGNLVARNFLNVPILDMTGGYNGWRVGILLSVVDSMPSDLNGYAFIIWLKWRAWNKGYKMKEIPTIFTERKVGRSKFNMSTIFEGVRMLFRMRREKK